MLPSLKGSSKAIYHAQDLRARRTVMDVKSKVANLKIREPTWNKWRSCEWVYPSEFLSRALVRLPEKQS